MEFGTARPNPRMQNDWAEFLARPSISRTEVTAQHPFEA